MKYTNDDKSLVASLSLTTWRKRNALSRELHGLNDRMLADVGINRHEISSIVEESFPRVRFMDVLKGLVQKWATARRNRQTARKLASFDDRMLADIGLNRSDILPIGQGFYPIRRIDTLPLMVYGIKKSSNAHAVNDDHRRAA
jgi:uncharacterized protein YjiS (DUF1127 family)